MSFIRLRSVSLLAALGVLLCALGAFIPSQASASGVAQAGGQQAAQPGIVPQGQLTIVVYSLAANLNPNAPQGVDVQKVTIGLPLQICYTVPGPGPITITKAVMAGADHVLLSGIDDGTGGCISDTVTAPTGPTCYQIAMPSWNQQPIQSAQVCQTVVQQSPLPL